MSIFKKITAFLGRALGYYRSSRPEDIPKKLSGNALAEAMREAKFLHCRHDVAVEELSPGELPGLPKRADLS